MTDRENMSFFYRKQGVALLLAIVAWMVLPASPALAGKHAVLIYDADSRQVLHQENGYSKRYPASLTKMMTLHMLFEQLRSKQMSLQTKMKVSSYAASQPQTNISLRPGSKITVDQAIRALVVRSANDVAVVVAEHLAGSEKAFAKQMTRRARQLGMHHTIFKNPHGLPDSGQITTAKDMAILGAALRLHYPQYYHYFSVKKFSYGGRNYTSHNRVLDKLPGVDGIKTGYIRASGFNLVSSLKHKGINIIAVVMGGKNSRERDARMVKLLDRTYTKLAAQRGDQGYQVAFAPTPVLKPGVPASKPQVLDQLVADVTRTLDKTATSVSGVTKPTPPSFKVGFNRAVDKPQPPKLGISVNFDESKETAAKPQSTGQVAVNAPKPVAKPAPVTTTLKSAAPKKHTLNYQLAAINDDFPVPSYVSQPKATTVKKDWAIQIGVFRDTSGARKALSDVARKVRKDLQGAVAHVEYAELQNKGFHRARLKNLSRNEASTVCKKLIQMNQDCFVTRIN